MRQTTKVGSEQLRIRVRDLEREKAELVGEVAELQRQLRRLEETARPLNSRLVGAAA
jgi:chromosome segregation ATPase